MKRIGLTMMASLITVAGHAEPVGVANPGFEQLLPDGTPKSWFVQPGPGTQSFTSDKGHHGKGGRLRVSGGSTAIGSLVQKIDPTPYRGKLIRLRLTFKANSAAHAGAFMTILRPDPYKVGFAEDASNRPTQVGKWQAMTITGRVAQDATAIWIGVMAVGEADVVIDDVRIEQLQGRSTPPSPQALAYLDQAIEILRTRHINTRKADWSRLSAEAHAEIAGARTPSDSYSAIRNLIGELGERHTVFIPPPSQAQIDAAKAAPGGVVARTEMPTSVLLDGRVGLVRLPGLDALTPGGAERGKSYSTILRVTLERFDKAPLCGWIVDLRDNTGGNMWPMLAGLDPLLGQSPFGFFVGTDGAAQPWVRMPGGIVPMALQPKSATAPAYALTHADAPLAVLIGPRTTSSGEMTALALIGRRGVRTFGGNSGGFISGNTVQPLPDGAYIAVTEVLVRDRAGKDYTDAIHPDVQINPDQAETAAKGWIEQQCRSGRLD